MQSLASWVQWSELSGMSSSTCVSAVHPSVAHDFSSSRALFLFLERLCDLEGLALARHLTKLTNNLRQHLRTLGKGHGLGHVGAGCSVDHYLGAP